ncbi:MAG: DUF2228 domain-containing protein [Myxococcales bacterium]|nr:DUF2228 domain-containing protein [Myxococcales bacterium]
MAKKRRERPGDAPPSAPAESPADRLAALYPLPFPDDLLEVWSLARRLAPRRPCEAFAALGLHLCGPFDALVGRHARRPKSPRLLEERGPNDPPELLTVAQSDAAGLRWGYYFDDPKRRAPLVCRVVGADAPTLTIAGATLAEALRAELERRSADARARLEEGLGESRALRRELAALARVREGLRELAGADAEEEGEAYLDAHVADRRSRRRPIALTRDGLGVVAPRRTCRDPDLDPLALREACRASDPARLVELAEAALADGFPATALQIARELWAEGGAVRQRAAAPLLAAAYRALRRPALAEIALAHAARHGEGEGAAEAPRGLWRIAALARIQPATIHLHDLSTAELEALDAATWPSVRRLELTLAPDAGYLDACARLLAGASMPALRHLVLLGGVYPRGLFTALADSALLASLDTLDFPASSLPDDERDAFIRAFDPPEELQLCPRVVGCYDSVEVYNLGILARDLGDYARALDLFERSVALGGDHWDYTEKGIALLELGELDAAVHAFHMALDRSEEYLVAWLHLAEAHRRADEFDDAELALKGAARAARGRRERLSLLGMRARLLASAGDAGGARELAPALEAGARELLARRSDDADLRYWLAAARLLAGDREEALTHLVAAIHSDPRHHEEALDDAIFASVHEEIERRVYPGE